MTNKLFKEKRKHIYVMSHVSGDWIHKTSFHCLRERKKNPTGKDQNGLRHMGNSGFLIYHKKHWKSKTSVSKERAELLLFSADRSQRENGRAEHTQLSLPDLPMRLF